MKPKANPPVWENGSLDDCMMMVEKATSTCDFCWGPRDFELVGGQAKWKIDDIKACYVYQRLDYLDGKSMILMARTYAALWAPDRLELMLLIVDLNKGDNQDAVADLLRWEILGGKEIKPENLHQRTEIGHLLNYIRERKWEKKE